MVVVFCTVWMIRKRMGGSTRRRRLRLRPRSGRRRSGSCHGRRSTTVRSIRSGFHI